MEKESNEVELAEMKQKLLEKCDCVENVCAVEQLQYDSFVKI